MVDQDSLFTAEDGEIALPTFNTNAIEPNQLYADNKKCLLGYESYNLLVYLFLIL